MLVAALSSSFASPASAARSPFPFGSWADLVERQYVDLLARAPSTHERSEAVATARDGDGPGAVVAQLRATPDQIDAVDPLVRLYLAYFDRAPDPGGLDFWIARRRNGTWPLVRVSQQFASSSEFAGIYGSLSDRAFVELVYANVLDRPGDPGGIDYWTRQLDLGRRSRGEVMVGFSESSEHIRTSAGAVTAAVLPVLLLDRTPARATFDDDTARLDDGLAIADYADELLTSAAYAQRVGTTPLAVVLGPDPGTERAAVDVEITPDGRFVAFASDDDDLVPGDTNGEADGFVWDRRTGDIERVSLTTGGDEAQGDTYDIAIADDGRFVAFSTQADLLTDGAWLGGEAAYRLDRATRALDLVSVTLAGEHNDGFSNFIDISSDGRYVSFFAPDGGIVTPPGPVGVPSRAFVRDMDEGTTISASDPAATDDDGTQPWFPDLSADGHRMAFEVRTTTEVAGQLHQESRIHLWDRFGGTTISPMTTAIFGRVSLSDDGSTVVAESPTGELLAWEPGTGVVEPLAFDPDGAPLAPDSQRAVALSGDGQIVAMAECPSDAGPQPLLVRDRRTDRTIAQAVPPLLAEARCQSEPALTRDGSLLAWTTPPPRSGPAALVLGAVDLGG